MTAKQRLYPIYVRVRQCLDIIIIGVFAILLFPVIIVVRVLTPVLHLRFGALKGDRIGHSALDVSLYLARREMQIEPPGTVDLLFFGARPRYIHPLEALRPINDQLGRMAKRAIRIHPLIRYLYFANRLVPGWKRWDCTVGGYSWGSRDLWHCLPATETHLAFLPEEDARARDYVRNIGLSDDDQWVCLNVRDSVFFGESADDTHAYRNSDIELYYDAAQWLAEQGYWVFRMGRTVKTEMAPMHPRVVDYASRSDRGDLMDVWLSAKCQFMVTTGCGVDAVSLAFRRPLVQVNFLPLGLLSAWEEASIILSKHLRWVADNRMLTLAEQIETGAALFTDTNHFRDCGIEVVDNSASEILEAVREMVARQAGSWEPMPGDDDRQDAFWNIFGQSSLFSKLHHPTSRCFIGAAALRDNPDFVEDTSHQAKA